MTLDKKPIHLLSQKSREQGRNLFLFDVTPQIFGMRAGLNLCRHPYVTNATLYRWIRLAAMAEERFSLFPVNLTKATGLVLYFDAEKAGNQLPENDDHPIPGDYGAYKIEDPPDHEEPMDIPENGSNIYGIGPFAEWMQKLADEEREKTVANPSYKSFLSVCGSILTELCEHRPATDRMNWEKHLLEYPPTFREEVSKRDQRCCITGTSCASNSKALEVTWIYLPNIASDLTTESNPDLSSYRSVANGILLHSDLIQPFQENSIGIDIDDEYRLVVFKDLSLQDITIPSHISPDFISPEQRPFLQDHFRYCLWVHFCGGDICDQYKREDVSALMEDLGLYGGDDDDVALVSLDDPRWQTEIGREVFEAHMGDLLAGKTRL
ncbi:hypothetical protein K439DRAFT_1640812 [Ramaria rubella]|nr:hypothetical protein K439DRAFT_1640812 [Ramaria rubella]